MRFLLRSVARSGRPDRIRWAKGETGAGERRAFISARSDDADAIAQGHNATGFTIEICRTDRCVKRLETKTK
jgi:hypothetical protein